MIYRIKRSRGMFPCRHWEVQKSFKTNAKTAVKDIFTYYWLAKDFN